MACVEYYFFTKNFYNNEFDFAIKIMIPSASLILSHYYNICSSLNDFLNTFHYAYNNIYNLNEDWIFFLKSSVKNKIDKPVTLELMFNSLDEINAIIKKMRNICKRQLTLASAIKQQKDRYYSYLISCEQRCVSDYRFVSESLRTSNRIHKQRLSNLIEKYESIPYKYNTILDVYLLLKCLLISDSKKSSNEQILLPIPQNESSDLSEINLDLLTNQEIELLLQVSFTID